MKVFIKKRDEKEVKQEELAVMFAGEVLPSAAWWPALGIVSVSLSRSQWAQINRQAELSGSPGPPPPRERELSHPSAGPDTTAPPTKQLFTPKHPEEEGTILITLQLRGRPSCPCCQRAGDSPTLYKAYCTSSSLSLLSCCSRARHNETGSAAAVTRRKRLKVTEGSVDWKQSLARSGTPGCVLALSSPGVRGYGEGDDGGWWGAGCDAVGLGVVFITAWLCSSTTEIWCCNCSDISQVCCYPPLWGRILIFRGQLVSGKKPPPLCIKRTPLPVKLALDVNCEDDLIKSNARAHSHRITTRLPLTRDQSQWRYSNVETCLQVKVLHSRFNLNQSFSVLAMKCRPT